MLAGHFRTPPAKRRDVRFLWSGDTAGQGWGIDLSFGGMKIYEAMRQTQADPDSAVVRDHPRFARMTADAKDRLQVEGS